MAIIQSDPSVIPITLEEQGEILTNDPFIYSTRKPSNENNHTVF